MKKTSFPVKFFLMYIIFYSAQSIYNAYVNLYLSDIGFSQQKIGLIVSVATAVLLLVQPLWGLASDRAKHKNTILKILFAGSAVVALTFPLTHNYWALLGVVAVFSAIYFPIPPLQDNLTLEYLEDTRWDFGQIRLGGTIGYAVTVAVVGMLLKDDYSRIFYMVSIGMGLCLLVVSFLPPITGHRHGEHRAPVWQIFRDKKMVCLIFFNLVYSLGSSLYYNFYSIYFQTIGGNSSYIGTMMFASAIAEVPFLLFASKISGRLGIQKMIVGSGIITSVRWLLLFTLRNPFLIIVTNLMNGLGFIVVNYCLAVYINTSVPKELRATGQTMMAILATFFSRCVFGYLGGLASDIFGVNNMMLFSSIITITATVIFAFWFRAVDRESATLSAIE